MSSQGQFSKLIPAERRQIREADMAEKGVYQFVTGENTKLAPLYMGKSDRSVKARVMSHAKGRGNKCIKDHLGKQEKNNLYVRQHAAKNPSKTEALALKRKNASVLPFNQRKETKALGKSHRSTPKRFKVRSHKKTTKRK
eukprot:m.44204 g.44204  ORF g.44204 m.44204 type:complete len:140 (+) comp33506_c0_seq1:88-507(+)